MLHQFLHMALVRARLYSATDGESVSPGAFVANTAPFPFSGLDNLLKIHLPTVMTGVIQPGDGPLGMAVGHRFNYIN